jgi:tetratricopeptide (TPR) repeat protein
MGRRHPEDSNIHYVEAGAYMKLAKLTSDPSYYEEALKHYSKAIELFPNNALYRVDRSKLYLFLDKPRMAAEDIVVAREGPKSESAVTDIYVSTTIQEISKSLEGILNAEPILLNPLPHKAEVLNALRNLTKIALLEEEDKLRVSEYGGNELGSASQDEVLHLDNVWDTQGLTAFEDGSEQIRQDRIESLYIADMKDVGKGEEEATKGYHNKLLLHEHLLGVSIARLGISKTLALSNLLSDDLVQEAIETKNPELILAGLLSLEE